MANEAAVLADTDTCPVHPTHWLCFSYSGPIIAPLSPDVNAHGKPMARAGDRAQCNGPVDFIVTGAAQVFINGKPAARTGSVTMHGGAITGSISDVIIGGDSVGTTLGNPEAGTAMCQDACRGRPNGSGAQSNPNGCGPETARQIANQANKGKSYDHADHSKVTYPINEQKFLSDASVRKHVSKQVGKTDGASVEGASNDGERKDILEDHGVGSSKVDPTMGNVAQGVAEGRGVITPHSTNQLYGETAGGREGGHVVVVTGVVYGPDGKPTSVIVNDTNQGTVGDNESPPRNPPGPARAGCGKSVPIDNFQGSLRPESKVNVTDKPIF